MKYIIVVIIIVWLVVCVLPLKGKWWVNDKYIYGGKGVSNDWSGVYCTGKKLSIYKHWKLTKIGMLNGKCDR